MVRSRSLRKILVLVVCVMVVFSALSVSASACWCGQSGSASVVMVSSGYSQARMAVLEGMADAANLRIEWLVRCAQATPYDDTAWLQSQVAATVAPVFAYAARIGATVICEYTAYEVDGQTVMVDPIRVIKG